MASFFSAASCKKDTIFGAAETNFGPSYCETDLDSVHSKQQRNKQLTHGVKNDEKSHMFFKYVLPDFDSNS